MEVHWASFRLVGHQPYGARSVLAPTHRLCDITSNSQGHIYKRGLMQVPIPPETLVGAAVGGGLRQYRLQPSHYLRESRHLVFSTLDTRGRQALPEGELVSPVASRPCRHPPG